MTTKVHKSVLVDVPVTTAYNQWTQFEDFPRFMGGVKAVHQLSDSRLHWVAEIAGVKREWEAEILEQVPDRKVAWAATEGATNAGAVTFDEVDGRRTRVELELEFDPEGLVEKAGDALHVVEKRAEADLQRFKEFIEDEGHATGAWRGSVNEGKPVGTPGVEDATDETPVAGRGGDDPGAPPGTPPAWPPRAVDEDDNRPPSERAQAYVDAETAAQAEGGHADDARHAGGHRETRDEDEGRTS